MRKIILRMSVSLDGFIEGPERELDWHLARIWRDTPKIVYSGGADLAASFRRLDLIDEYRLYVHPVLIGRGKPMFPPADAMIDLRLTQTRTFGNGVVLLRYQRPDVPDRETTDAQPR